MPGFSFIEDPLFYALAVPALIIVGISKGGFGGTLGLVGVPMMALVVHPAVAAAVMLPILCVMDLIGAWAYRRSWDRRNMVLMVPAAVLGIVLGSLTFEFLSADGLRLLIGGIAVVFTLHHWLRSGEVAGRDPFASRRGRIGGWFWCATSGLTSFVAHSGGPPLNVFLLPQRLDKTVYAATTVMFFAVINYIKLVPYLLLGQFTGEVVGSALILMPLAPIGIGLGIWLHKRVPEKLFYRVCYGFVFLSGLKLLYDGVTGLAGA